MLTIDHNPSATERRSSWRPILARPSDVKVHKPTQAKLRSLVHVFAGALIFYSVFSFVLWWFFPVSISTGPLNDQLLRPFGAIITLIGGCALESLSRRFEDRKANIAGRVGGAIVLLMGAVVLAYYQSNRVFDIFGLTVRFAPGVLIENAHMPEAAAFFVMLLGAGMMLVDCQWKKFQPSALLSLFVCSLALFACLTDIYRLTALYMFPPLHVLVTIAADHRISFGWLRIIVLEGRSPRGLLFSQKIPRVVRWHGGCYRRLFFVPLLLGWLRMSGEQLGLFGPDAGRAVLAVSMVLTFFVLIWWTSRSLDNVDKARLDIADTLQESEKKRMEEISRANLELASIAEQLATARDRALESARSKSEFLANMSHEIRTPMTAVISGSKLLESNDLTRDQLELVSVITAAGHALLQIIDNILSYSRLEAGKCELESIEFDLAQLVESTVDLFWARIQEKKIVLTTYVSPLLSRHMVGDPARLREVLINLIGNAVKFTEVGQIVLRVQPMRIGGNSCVRFSITDTGIGMDKEALEHLFQPFVQADSSISRHYGGYWSWACVFANVWWS